MPLVSVLNKRLPNSYGDVKIGLMKCLQLVASSERLLTSRCSADLFHMLQGLCIFSPGVLGVAENCSCYLPGCLF